MQASNLKEILTALKESSGNLTEFDESWSQGRSAFGGLSAAFAVTAMRKLVAEDIPLRSLMVSFTAPIPPGEVTVQTRIQREGKNVIQLNADVISDGSSCLQAIGVFGKGRDATTVSPVDDFNPKPRDQGISFAAHSKRTPTFLNYFDGCWAGGGLPLSGSKDRELSLWARLREEVGDFQPELVCLIADIPPPVMLSHFTAPTPASSLTWSLEFVTPADEIKTEWFYLDFTLEAAAGGYTQQSGRIYTEDGQLCALSRQCMVYFEQSGHNKK